MTIDWRPLIAIVHDSQRFVITSHVRPDADAIGSEMGLAGVLRSLGKEVRIVNPSAVMAGVIAAAPSPPCLTSARRRRYRP